MSDWDVDTAVPSRYRIPSLVAQAINASAGSAGPDR